MNRVIPSLITGAAALVGTALPASAQVVEILPELGVSSVKYDSDMFDSSTGLGLEIGGKVRVGRRFYVEPGIFFAWSGADISDVTDEGNLSLGDFRVPLVVGLKVIATRVLEFRVFGGGGAAFVTSVSGDRALEDISTSDVTNTLWNARVGVGADFTLVSADVGYDFGLTNLNADPDPGDSDINRNGFFLEAGLRFGF